MKDTGLFVFSMLALVGLCAIVGIFTRGMMSDNEERDNIVATLLRGFGVVLCAFAALSAIATVLYILYLPFS